MQKILIANRGEIALRIIKTCKQMGIETVAVYSDADSSMPYVKEADFSFRIGEAPVNKSYLNMDEIIKIALDERVDGIHPGYGLLSENYRFANMVRNNGIKFIGPSPETIESMGDKIKARMVMKKANVPIVPGSINGLKNLQEAQELANQIGYPIMLKASGGGGGIGMVRCENEQALNQHYESTRKRSKAYFGSEDVFIEKCIDDARHIEVQIFGDQYGEVVHLFERNCSVQRRNQKVIEEAQSPQLSKETQEKMYAAAISAARAIGYENAGTVEFIVDQNENFYFLEMNTRLQVEHPITEMLTNLDLVQWQILVARGEKLPLSQKEITKQGHAIELRIYAEDPNTFYPSPGLISKLSWGDVEEVRIDEGYCEGIQVTPFYDPMIAKCVIFERNRDACLNKAKEFLEKTTIEGIKTNIPYLIKVLKNKQFKNGDYTTNLVNKLMVES
ncbi:acetyl-CoA carboxylase biotin carboxylase subunit [Heyndrickxia sp. NPDC080065]|uniref:acetyl-CoA carboxylase biotin carboxylase subunit n=1 Tax=Heyndrickxia sp. NPDC080065 TaxID=3390568 RepID=UPI003D09586F